MVVMMKRSQSVPTTSYVNDHSTIIEYWCNGDTYVDKVKDPVRHIHVYHAYPIRGITMKGEQRKVGGKSWVKRCPYCGLIATEE